MFCNHTKIVHEIIKILVFSLPLHKGTWVVCLFVCFFAIGVSITYLFFLHKIREELNTENYISNFTTSGLL